MSLGPSINPSRRPCIILPSKHVCLIKNPQNRSVRLPTLCDSCDEFIEEYPFIVNSGSGYRKYHVVCALRIGLILSVEA